MDAQKKLELFKRILSLGSIWGQMDEVDFLNQIWNLHLLNSDDPRYKDAYGDAIQHLRNNSDWDEEYTFLTRFGLLKATDDTFYKFLNMVVAPEVRGSEEEILSYVREINTVLIGTNCALERIATRDNLPVYNFVENIQGKLWPEDIEKNRIPIFFTSTVDEYPAFVLRSINWDDFGNKTSFELYYYDENRQVFPIGSVKIMYDYKENTADVLPEKCLFLSERFCSVGQALSYYSAIKDLFPQKYKSILFALRDAAYFSSIADIYQQTIAFQKSLLRYKSAFEAYRNAVCVLEGIDISQRYNFSVRCEIPYCKEELIPVKFFFGNLDNQFNLDRVKALIGENGSGKSSVLYSLAKAMNENRKDCYVNHHKPAFSKTIAISYSIFDRFYELTSRSSYNFIYCGLRKDKEALYSDEDMQRRFHLSLQNIQDKERVAEYWITLQEVVEKEKIKGIIGRDNKIIQTKFDEAKRKMSSGQAMMTNIITELYAHIRENSLILFDEPEVHLHPNGITKLISIIYDICQEFKSACIIATHSSVVLQEMLARNVTVIEQDADGKSVLVRPMNTETLGENLTTITDDVFGRAEISKHYCNLVRRYIRQGYDENRISELLKSDGLPMSLNLYMYIRQRLKKGVDDD